MCVNSLPELSRINLEHVKLLACATVIEEMRPLIPPQIKYEILDFGHHTNPEAMKRTLQDTINVSSKGVENIVLGFGLCSMAVVGLKSESCRLVVPRVDDCIGIFLGSEAAYLQQTRSAPGTYYLSKGLLAAGDTPFDDYDTLIEKYGEKKARLVMSEILRHYTRLAFINTGQYHLERYRARARRISKRFGLRYEEISGSNTLILKMLYGPWDDDFVIAAPGETISYLDFKKSSAPQKLVHP